MAYDEKLADRIRSVLIATTGLSERKMFGGLCFALNGHMTCGVQNDDLVARVGPDSHEAALKRAHTRPMDFTGRPMKGYVYVSADGLKRRANLERWVSQSVEFVESLPPKKPKKWQQKKRERK